MEKMFFIVLLIFPIVYSCNRSNESERNSEKGKFFNVDIERDINATRQIKISSISDSVEYIALETNPDCLLAEIRNITMEEARNYLSALQIEYEGFNPVLQIYKAKNAFGLLKDRVKHTADSFLVLQQGSRSLRDYLFRKFMINELVYNTQTPLIVLSL